jgi:opacity protein-like surface antigen
MKRKIFAFLALVITAGTVSAQIPANTLSLGGCFGFNSTTEEQQPPAADIKTNSFALGVNAIYMFNSNWGAGITTGYESEKVDNGSTESINNAFHFGLIGKYQYGIIEKASCYLKPSIVLTTGKEETETFIPSLNQTITVTDKFTAFAVGVTPGIHYQIKPKWHLDLGLGMLKYETTTWKPDDSLQLEDYKVNSFGFKLDTKSIRVGATYIIGSVDTATR